MKFNNVNIDSFDYYVPENLMSSDEVEKKLEPIYEKLKLPFGRLELMTGIKSRGVWPIGTRPSDLATIAAKNALETSSIKTSDIGVLIHASVCRDFLEPATASVVHSNLKLSNDCMIFDLSNACLGVLSSFLVVANMIEQGTIKAGLIVSGENSGPLLEQTINHLLNDSNINRKNIKKYIANLTIGSAATAYILTHKDLSPNGHKILGGSTMTNSDANKLCQGTGDTNSLMMETNSEELMHVGVELAKDTWSKTKNILDWNNETPDWVITHQVGVAHEKITLESLELENNKTYKTYDIFGNTGSAALPITLAKLAKENGIKKNEKVALLGIGSGLSSTMLGVEW